jgi:hypothetical protein
VFAGQHLPKATFGAATLPSPHGTGVVIIGGYAYDTQRELYELKCSSSSCNWSLMEQHLSVNRLFHVAIYVPDSFAVCEH